MILCATPLPALTVEAETAPLRTTGAPLENGWNLHSNGAVGEYLRIEKAGKFEVVVRAYGSAVGGVWPQMALAIDRQPRSTVTVDTKEFKDFRFEVELAAGLHTVAATFLNDAVGENEDRNLYLDRIVIRPLAGALEPTVAKKEELSAAAHEREKETLDWTAGAIRRNRQGRATVTVTGADGKAAREAGVRVELLRHDFLFGCNIYGFDRFQTPAENAAYKERFAELFNYATTGFYWRAYEREKGKPDYAYTDKVVVWCRARGIRLKGHPLLWQHEAGVPRWSDGQPAPEVQRQRVREIMQRYEGKIEFWEVVNEAACLHELKIDEPYRWAREASPAANLIVNDYYVMANGYPPFYKLCEEAIANHVPFDGIGIQAHEPADMAFPLDRVRSILDDYAKLGKQLHITEYTPCSNGKPVVDAPWRGTWTEEQQAAYAVDFYRVCFAHPKVAAITWWDLCDAKSWRKKGGLLREDLAPKPVFDALKKLIHQEWRTRAEGKADYFGNFAFDGFYGEYKITVQHQGRMRETKVHFERDQPNQFWIKLR